MESFTKVCSRKDLVNGRYLTVVDGKAIALQVKDVGQRQKASLFYGLADSPVIIFVTAAKANVEDE